MVKIFKIARTYNATFIPIGLNIILKNKKGSRDMYNVFIFNKSSKKRNVTKWSIELQLTGKHRMQENTINFF